MKRYFIISIGLLVLNALVSAFIVAGELNLNAEHYGLLFVFLSYVIFFIGLIQFNIIRPFDFLKFDLIIIVCLIIWYIFNIFRSLNIPFENINTIPRFLGGSLYSPAYILPFYIFLGGSISILHITWNYAKKFIVFFIILCPLIFIYDAKSLITIIGFLPLVFLNQDKLSIKEKILVNLAFSIYMVFSVWKGNRTDFVGLMYYLILMSLIINRNKFKSVIEIRKSGIFLIIFLALGFGYMYSGNLSKHFSDENIVENIKSFEKDNLNTDSRTMVFEDFASDFKNWPDLMFGRGVLGTTYSPQFIILQRISNTENNVFNFPVGYRLEIENGYLQIILKSGIIGLLLFLTIAFRAIFLGLFRSKNTFTAVCTFIIVERILSMTGFGLPSYSMEDILYWLCIGVCLSEGIRNLSSIEMYFLFKGVKYYHPKFIKGSNIPEKTIK